MATFMKKKSKVFSRESRVRVKSKDENQRFNRKDSQLSTTNSQLIYGVLPVLEALRANPKKIEKILIAEGGNEKRLNEIFSLAKENRVQFQNVPRQNLSKFVEQGANHQGIVAFVASAEYYDADKLLEEISKSSKEAKNLTGNFGWRGRPAKFGRDLRTVECAGVDGVFIPERRCRTQ